eukprot:TRINITY_DN8274_c0_g1_i1.p1 TRINITY_DN8274_c0_g1~~TRINITY_DN8274_c0_g1_i1.p1  ORF type:complete len:109 (-),score=11.97 TRINITY_DN8274_c0_g1_i1:93-419(-)
MILYLWSRRNRNVLMHVFGFLPLKAPYLIWFFLFFSATFGHPLLPDIIGLAIGHLYYFFVDVFPKLPLSKNKRLLKTPRFFRWICKTCGMQGDNQDYQDLLDVNDFDE